VTANSDVRKLIDLAEQRGLEVVKVKHGGYAVKRGEETIARIPLSGAGPGYWVRNARRRIEAA
jgi:hypothetical protein